MLAHILKLQSLFMTVLEISNEKADTVLDPRIIDCILGLTSEVGEVAQAVNYKKRVWAEQDPDAVFQMVAEEAIDILFYLTELFIVLGFSEHDIVCLYETKLLKNLTRKAATLTDPDVKLSQTLLFIDIMAVMLPRLFGEDGDNEH